MSMSNVTAFTERKEAETGDFLKAHRSANLLDTVLNS